MTFYCLNLFFEKPLCKIKIRFRTFWNFNIHNVRKTLILVRWLIIVSGRDWNGIELLGLLTFMQLIVMLIFLGKYWLRCSKLLIWSVFFNWRWLSARRSFLKCLAYALILLIEWALHRLLKCYVLHKTRLYLLLNRKVQLFLHTLCARLN